jgi:YD repeat-containing protein
MTQPLVGTTTFSNFDNLGNPQSVTDPNGNSTTYTYDTNGRVSTVRALGDTNATQYFYVSGGCGPSCSGSGKIDHITMPEGNTITYHYDDGMGNPTSISDSLGNSINYTYDSEGNKLTEQIKDSSGTLQKSLSYQYDALNRLQRITNPDSNYTEYSYYLIRSVMVFTDLLTCVVSDFGVTGSLKKTVTPTGGAFAVLSDAKVKNAKGREKTYKINDGQGLYLRVTPNDGKWWWRF